MKPALIQWEILRLPFNLILITLGLIWSWPLRQTMVEEAFFGYWGSVAAYGFVANVFYTLGPALEAYLHALKNITLGRWRRLLWSLGLLLSIGMTWGFVWSMEILYIVLYPSRK